MAIAKTVTTVFVIIVFIKLFNMFCDKRKETKKMVHGKMVDYMYVCRKRKQKGQSPPRKKNDKWNCLRSDCCFLISLDK